MSGQSNAKKRGLGKGIGAILGASDPVEEILEEAETNNESVKELYLEQIHSNPQQPRESFSEKALQELASSIKSYGIIQPIVVQPEGDGYHIIAGERRYRAARLAGLTKVPVIIRELSEMENISFALIENVQREDLNAIEEAKAYKLLLERFHLKQQDLAERIGKERSTITNTIRLLDLTSEIQDAVVGGVISGGHARTLLSVKNEKEQLTLFERIKKDNLSVRQLEKEIKEKKTASDSKNKKKKSEIKEKDAQIKMLEEELRASLGTKVAIDYKGEKGKIEIYFYSLDDFERIRDLLT